MKLNYVCLSSVCSARGTWSRCLDRDGERGSFARMRVREEREKLRAFSCRSVFCFFMSSLLSTSGASYSEGEGQEKCVGRKDGDREISFASFSLPPSNSSETSFLLHSGVSPFSPHHVPFFNALLVSFSLSLFRSMEDVLLTISVPSSSSSVTTPRASTVMVRPRVYVWGGVHGSRTFSRLSDPIATATRSLLTVGEEGKETKEDPEVREEVVLAKQKRIRERKYLLPIRIRLAPLPRMLLQVHVFLFLPRLRLRLLLLRSRLLQVVPPM